MTDASDSDVRESIRSRLDATLIVEAAAGTGKTTELVNRIIAVLADGRAGVDGIVAVTFTEKAAGELKLRLRAGLEDARHRALPGSAPRRHLEHALARLEEARVGTIHGFCADLLRERPVEARVDPQFRVLTEAEAERLFGEAFTRWLQEQLQNPPEGVRRSLRRRGRDGPTERLRRAGWQLAEWRDFPTAWRRDPFDRCAAIDDLVQLLDDFATLSEHCGNPRGDAFYRDTAGARRLRDLIRRAESVRPRDYDDLESALIDLVSPPDDLRRARRGSGKFYFKDIARAAVHSAHAELCTALIAFKQAADADLAAALHDELRGSVQCYESLKQRAGVLDFVDLLVSTRNLIRDSTGVRAEFQRRFTHIFVDEFQDTDPLQAEILLLLAADDGAERDWRAVRPVPGKLFIVGDPKQSIYRFRRADVGIYLEVKELLAQRGAECVYLRTSYRAVPAIQRFVNAAFAPRLKADRASLQADYVPLDPYRTDAAAQPTVIALPVPRPYGAIPRITQKAIDRSLPQAVAAFLQWLLKSSGWTVTERERQGARVPINPRHICLLFRRFDSFYVGDVTRGYVSALEARGIPHLLVGGRSFHGREEVETMRAALTAVEWPDDELAVFATLRGSLFAIGDEELLLYRHAHRRLQPFHIADDLPIAQAPIGEALRLLATLHRGRNRRPVADTIALLLEATRAHAGFALRPSGEQALANVLHLAELARTYESGGGMSFRGFVERLLDDADGGQASEAPILEEGSDGVRIMTVHRAKGLEFPVVVLADITAGLTGSASRYVDPVRRLCALRISGWVPAELSEHQEEEARRDEAEGLRVAYVAASRARDLLVVPAVGDERFGNGWVSCLNDALYPAAGQWREATRAAGCPQFGGDTVLERPAELAFSVEGVKPGRHAFEGYDVVWWDPALLHLDALPRFGIRQEELLGKEAERALVDRHLQGVAAWQAGRDAARAAGSRPSASIATATAFALRSTAPPDAVDVVELPRASGRPFGPRFGALVHAVLAVVALDAGRDGIERAAAVQARLLGAPADEIAAAVDAAVAALAHPLLQRAAAAAACRRETPLTLRADDGTLVEGTVDLAFLDDGTWTVIDFKTDQELTRSLDVYRRQVALYARAISAATGAPARPVLLRV